MKKFFLFKRTSGNPIFMGVTEGAGMKELKTLLRNNLAICDDCFLDEATEPRIAWYKHIKVIPSTFDLLTTKTIQL